MKKLDEIVVSLLSYIPLILGQILRETTYNFDRNNVLISYRIIVVVQWIIVIDIKNVV